MVLAFQASDRLYPRSSLLLRRYIKVECLPLFSTVLTVMTQPVNNKPPNLENLQDLALLAQADLLAIGQAVSSAQRSNLFVLYGQKNRTYDPTHSRWKSFRFPLRTKPCSISAEGNSSLDHRTLSTWATAD